MVQQGVEGAMAAKKLIVTGVLGGALALSASAQLLSPEAFTGAALGAMIGGVAGGNTYYNGCRYYSSFSGEGAAIGAGIGLLAGALLGEANRRQAASTPSGDYVPAPTATVGYGYASPYVYTAPNAYLAPAYYYRASRPNYAVGGTLLGAASGALIGGGSEEAGKGAAIGAAAGLVLGSAAEALERRRERKLAVAAQPSPVAASSNSSSSRVTAGDTGPAPITSTPASNSTYTWAARPQIPDAPRVSDAPTF